MNIITLAFDMAAAVEKFLAKAKWFYYLVMLFGYRCPKCKGLMMMVAEGRCRCRSCKYEFDPTIEFQRCLACGGVPILQVRRYQCNKCGGDITSKFLFDGIVFDAEYYSRKMAESRRRKKEQKQRVQQMLSECRSEPLALDVSDLNSVPGLLDALNGLTAGLDASAAPELKDKFDLSRYQEHIRSHLETEPIDLRQIPPLTEDQRLDLIWKFIAAIFLDHVGLVEIYQQDDTIWVMKFDDRKRQRISDEIEEIDGFERLKSGTHAW
ncbi:hypothetical protein ACFL3Q_11485 [Planctomycetota bacterium]